MHHTIFLLAFILALAGGSARAEEPKEACSFPVFEGDNCPDQDFHKDKDKKGPGHPGDKDGDWDDERDDDDRDHGDRHPGRRPGHGPGHGPGHDFPGFPPGHGGPGFHEGYYRLCSGGFQGHYYGQPYPVAFLIQDNGFGQLHVQAWYAGGYWVGQGVCRPLNPYQASFELYFPHAPIHRGMISRDQFGGTVMQGQLDFHGPFQLQRTR
jgi:hypothetical protein